MWLFVGLGNPGGKYAGNRHNVGFMVLDAIADGAMNFLPFKSKFQGKITESRVGSDKVLLLKPETYMNNSGQSVLAAAAFYKILPDHIVVFHDELDLAPGDVRVKQGGGNAGHNGLKSIQAHLGTADFWRVRIGIGHPGERNQVSNYVLSDFSKADQDWLGGVLEALSDYYETIVTQGPENYGQVVSDHIRSYLKSLRDKE